MKSAVRALAVIALLSTPTACGIYSPALVPPVIIVVNGAVIPSGPAGSVVVLNGAEFQGAQGSGAVLFTPSPVGLPLPGIIRTPIDWSDQTIVVTVPAVAPGQTYITVNAGNSLQSNSFPFIVTPATFNPSGLTWTAAGNIPSALSGVGVTSAQIGTSTNCVYSVGGAGAGGAPVSSVYYATVGPAGAVGSWQSTTSLPTALAFTAAAAATQYNSSVASSTGYLYAIGGTTNASGTPVATIYRAAITGNCTVGGWSQVGTLGTAVRSAGAMVWYGGLYVAGGAGAGNAPRGAVYRWPIQVDGGIPTLKPQPSLPAGRSRFGFAASGLYLYIFGGDGGSVTPNDSNPAASQASNIYYAKLASNTHDVLTWTQNGTSLPAGRSAETAVIGPGFVLVTGGLYGGATAEEIYAPVNADGTVGSFTAASGSVGRNLFNHGATGYSGGDGSFHVLVVGGDDAGAAGTRRQETFTY